MARILGLDLGSHSLKAVVLETTLRGHTVKGYAEVPVPTEGDRNERLTAALPQLLPQLGVVPDLVVVSLPGTALATHPISLPFSDPKKIDATLPYEVENELPYDLDDAVFDYQVGTTDEKGAHLLVGVVRKDELEGLLDALKASRVDPRFVTHPGLVYQNLLSEMPSGAADEAVAIVDIGHERTNIAIGRPGGGVEVARTIAGGGAALTRALAKEFEIDLVQAETWKKEHGAVGPEVVGADAERAAGAMVRAFHPVLRELRPTLKSYTVRTRLPVTRLVLCGGTALLPGLTAQLSRDLGLPVTLLELPLEALNAIPQGASPVAAQAWALAMRGQSTGAKAPRFNLRRGAFAFKSDLDFMRDKLGQLVAFGLVLFVLLIASGIVRNAVLERNDKQLDAVLCDVTRRILGTCEKDYNIAINRLSGQESPAAGIPKRSALTILAELTQRMPQNINVVMDQVVIDLDRISVRCEAATSKDMEDIAAALKTYKCFKEIKEGKVEKTKDGTHVQFRLDVQIECPEDAALPQG